MNTANENATLGERVALPNPNDAASDTLNVAQSPSSARLALTVYAGIDPTPRARDSLTWDTFCDEVDALCREESAATDKTSLKAFGPYKLRDGATRSAANVETMSVCMLDVDHGLDLDKLRSRIVELGIAAIAHGTPSDDVDGERRARVYIRLDGEHPPADAGRVRLAVAALLGVEMDPSTINADRIGFVGRLAGTPPRYVERFDGRPLALAELPDVTPTTTTTASTTASTVTSRPSAAKDAAKWAILGALGPAAEHDGSKHAVCGALGGMLRKAGWSRDDAADVVRAWVSSHPAAGTAAVDVEAGVRWACKAWDKPSEDVSGRGALDRVVGPDVASVIEEATLLPWRARARTGIEQPEPTPTADDVSEFSPLQLVDLTKPLPPIEYVIPALDLAPGKVSCIQGGPFTGKTPFALLLASCVAAGVPFLGCEVKQGPVLYIAHEGGQLTQERAQRIHAGLSVQDIPMYYATVHEAFSEAEIDAIERLIERHSIKLVVIDTYSSAVTDATFNDAAIRGWADRLGHVSDRTGVCFEILLHETKAAHGKAGLAGISGHATLGGAVQSAIALSRPNESERFTIEVRCARDMGRGFDPFTVVWSDPDDPNAPTGRALVATRTDAPIETGRGKNLVSANDARKAEALRATRIAGERIMSQMSSNVMVARAELVKLGGEGVRPADRALARLVDAGLLEVNTGSYQKTEAGRMAGELGIANALGATAGFQR